MDIQELSVQSQFANLRKVSENVCDYLDRELYNDEFNPLEVEVNDILQACYKLVLNELDELGIHFCLDRDEMLDDGYTARNISDVRDVFDVNTLTKYLNTEEIISAIESAFDIQDETAIQAMIESLNTAYPNNPVLTRLYQFSPFIVSDHKLLAHVGTIIGKIRLSGILDDIDIDKAAMNFILATQKKQSIVRQKVKELFDEVSGYSLPIDQKLLEGLILTYDKDKLTAENLKYFAYFMAHPEDKRVEKIKEAMLDAHHKRSTHHIEYWETHEDVDVDIEHMAVLFAHPYTEDLEETKELLPALVKRYKDHDNVTIQEMCEVVERWILKL